MSFIWRDSKWMVKRLKPYQVDLCLNKPYLRKDHMAYMGREGKGCNDVGNYYNNNTVIKDAVCEQISWGLEVANGH